MSVSRIGAQLGKISRYTPGCRSMSTTEEPQQRHIALYNVPRLTTPADIRRGIAGKLQGVADVELDYNRFRPSGKAIITLTRHEFLRDNLRALEKLTFCGIPVRAAAIDSPQGGLPRLRGATGRAAAVARGVILGNGPQGNFPNVERNVIITGFPGKFEPNQLEDALEGFKLARTKQGEPTVVRLPIPEGRFSLFSSYLVTMASVSEARRLARHLHMTEQGKTGVQLRVKVLC